MMNELPIKIDAPQETLKFNDTCKRGPIFDRFDLVGIDVDTLSIDSET